MTYLIKVTEQYRCDTEDSAKELIEKAKNSRKYTVIKSSDEIKVTKAKGEIVDEWHRVIITKEITSEKEPDSMVSLNYREGDFEDEED